MIENCVYDPTWEEKGVILHSAYLAQGGKLRLNRDFYAEVDKVLLRYSRNRGLDMRVSDGRQLFFKGLRMKASGRAIIPISAGGALVPARSKPARPEPAVSDEQRA